MNEIERVISNPEAIERRLQELRGQDVLVKCALDGLFAHSAGPLKYHRHKHFYNANESPDQDRVYLAFKADRVQNISQSRKFAQDGTERLEVTIYLK